MEEHINKFVNDNPDSLTFGTPSKGGEIKCYGNWDKPEEFKAKLERAIEVRKQINEKLVNE